MTNRTVAGIAAAVVAVDVVTKIIAATTLAGDPIEFGVIDLRLVHNEGVAFGLGDWVPPALLLAAVVALTVALTVAVSRGSLPASAATGFVLGGAIANLADRAIGGSVVDMLDLGWWPAFNVAAICIVVGVAGLFMQSLRPASGVVQESV